MIRATTALTLIFLAFTSVGVGRQETTNQGLELQVRLRLITLEGARSRYEQVQELFEAGLVSEDELHNAEMRLRQAEVEYQYGLVALVGDRRARVRVVDGQAIVGQDGRLYAEIAIKNFAVSSKQLPEKEFYGISDFIPTDIDVANNVIVSLLDSDAVTVSSPFELLVDSLQPKEERRLRFELLRNEETVLVRITHRDQVEEKMIILRRPSGNDRMIVRAQEFSQEAYLGAELSYSVELERSSRKEEVFQIFLTDLPSEVETSVLAADRPETKISQLHFSEGESQKRLLIRLRLPEFAPKDVLELDKPHRFWMIVASGDFKLPDRSRGPVSRTEFGTDVVGDVGLEVIPSGRARLEMRTTNLFREIEQGGESHIIIHLKNTGSRKVHGIRVNAEVPSGWLSEIAPPLIESLDLNEEAPVELVITPPVDAQEGDYAIRVSVETAERIHEAWRSDDVVLRIRVAAVRSSLYLILLTLSLVLLVSTVFFGIRFGRR